MEIIESLRRKIKCPNCKHIGNFEIIIKSDSEYSLFDKHCGKEFMSNKGILNLIGRRASTQWDKLYKMGIKGNPVRTAEDLDHLLSDMPPSLSYFPLVELLNDMGVTFKESVEIGCGSGIYSLLLKTLGIVKEPPVLVDTSYNGLLIAKKLYEIRGEKALLILADGLDLPFADKSFDLGLSGGLIEHFADSKQQRIISEHCRVAKNVICQCPTPSIPYWFQRAFVTLLNAGWPFGFEVPISYDKLVTLFKREGFKLGGHNYHDLLSMFLFRSSLQFRFIKPLKSKWILNKLLKTEIVCYFENAR